MFENLIDYFDCGCDQCLGHAAKHAAQLADELAVLARIADGHHGARGARPHWLRKADQLPLTEPAVLELDSTKRIRASDIRAAAAAARRLADHVDKAS